MAINKSTEIAGAGNYPSTRLRQRERKILEVAETLTDAVGADWASTDPTTLVAAINRLAASYKDLLAKLDADAGITDTDYEATLLP